MTKRIFRAVWFTALAVFLATMMMIVDVLYTYFNSVQQKQLAAQTSMAAAALEHAGADFLSEIDTEEYRVTWVASDGTVLYDSSADSGTMENHLERTEIQEALANGEGESSRYSTTLMKRELYCARRLSDGTVLRLSVSHGSVLLLLSDMLQPVLVIVAIAALISFLMAKGLSEQIVEPLNRFDLDAPAEDRRYPELDPLVRRLRRQQSEIRERTASLTRKQNELNTIIGNMKEGMLLVDGNGNVLAVNRAAKEMLDLRVYEGDQLFGSGAKTELRQAFEKAMRGETAELRTEFQNLIIQISSAPVRSEGKIAGAAIVLFDITQRERAEQQRREFTANVSHELKTPLQSISGYSELLECGITKPEDVQAFAAKIYSETRRLIALVKDIINLSHLDEGGTDLKWQEVDLYASAEAVKAALAEPAARNGVTLSLSGRSSRVRGVPELIHGILYNLCDNAIKYNRPGGKAEIRVSERTIEIRDTGIGIPKEHLDRIFERFYRVDKSHSREVGGTGLGLSIVKHAALIHNAHISVESEPGRGTVVTVVFPEERGKEN